MSPQVPGLPTGPGRTLVMAILNVTPDSFSDGGRYLGAEQAIAHGKRLLAEGADILDVGGESTRPGATRPLLEQELDRVIPVIEALAATGAVISVDTMRAEVARAAIEAGARIVNDVSGGLADPDMLATVAPTAAVFVAMHWRGHSRDMSARATYTDVVAEVRTELEERVSAALAAGIGADRLVLDPGLGFAKRPEHDWALLGGLEELNPRGLPMLVGASRKSMLGALLADDAGPRALAEREAATVAVTALAARAGVWAVRVHEARASADAVRVVARWRSAEPDSIRSPQR